MTRTLLVAATAALVSSHALAQDMPKMKVGLWETNSVSGGQKGMPAHTTKTSMCLNEAVQKDMLTFGQNMGASCSKNSIRRDGNKILGNAECAFGGTTIKSQSVTTFTGDTAYRTEVRATFSPPMGGMSESTTTQDGKHMGACPAGMKPGDINTGGKVMNIADMAKMMKGAKK